MSKPWKISGWTFIPHFEVKDEKTDSPQVECTGVEIISPKKEKGSFNFTNLFQFIYFIANEELRRGLALRYQKQVYYIPYEVTFKLDKHEIEAGMAKRRINLPVDELHMAVAKNEAWKIVAKQSGKLASGYSPNEIFKGRK